MTIGRARRSSRGQIMRMGVEPVGPVVAYALCRRIAGGLLVIATCPAPHGPEA